MQFLKMMSVIRTGFEKIFLICSRSLSISSLFFCNVFEMAILQLVGGSCFRLLLEHTFLDEEFVPLKALTPSKYLKKQDNQCHDDITHVIFFWLHNIIESKS